MAKKSVVFKNSGSTIIGKTQLDYIDFKNHKKEKDQVPGPGAYKVFSEFGQIIEWNAPTDNINGPQTKIHALSRIIW